MSLKAKLEAVIYAAEEPVTLAQLAVLFSTDALESKSEQETASASVSTETQEAVESPIDHGRRVRLPGSRFGPASERKCPGARA